MQQTRAQQYGLHLYQNVSRCTIHGIHPYKEQNIYSLFFADISSVTPRKVYTLKGLELIET